MTFNLSKLQSTCVPILVNFIVFFPLQQRILLSVCKQTPPTESTWHLRNNQQLRTAASVSLVQTKCPYGIITSRTVTSPRDESVLVTPYNRYVNNPNITWESTADCLQTTFRGRNISVGIATRYELDGPGIESRWGARFSAPVQTGPGAHPASCTMGTGSFQVVKRPERGVDHPPHLTPRLKEE